MGKTYGVMLKGEMVRAYVKGIKGQTRRMKGLNEINTEPDAWEKIFSPKSTISEKPFVSFCRKGVYDFRHITMPYGDTSSTLLFKETYRMWERDEDGRDFILYRADNAKVDPDWWTRADWDLVHSGWFDKWQSAMFMPFRFSRFRNVEILSVRVERLQDITEEDAIAEGVSSRAEYKTLWNMINGKEFPWSKNPWVFVYEFAKHVQQEI